MATPLGSLIIPTTKISALHLVYPPISVQEADWLKSLPAVEELMRQSDFYMIAGRAEAHFEFGDIDPETMNVALNIALTTGLRDEAEIRGHELPGVEDAGSSGFRFHAGPKIIKIFRDDQDEKDEPVEWFTTERFLCSRWCGRSGLYGLPRVREFATYDLLYVGIATERDSYDRVIKGSHDAKLAVLINEMQHFQTSRVADETFLFLFRIDPLFVTTFESVEEIEVYDFEQPPIADKAILADAEQAFIKLLDPKYNNQKYKNYPNNPGNLSAAGHRAYAYVIGESLTFNTPSGTIRGGHDPQLGWSPEADAIMVRDGALHFYRAGDLNAEG